MMKKIIGLSTLLMIYHPAYALFCPENYNQIQVGDSLEQVLNLCGKPGTKTETKSEPNIPQQWQFYIKPDPNNAGTVNLTVVFNDAKVVSLTVNGTNIMTTPLCGGSIAYGNTMDQVKAACGKPSFVTKGTPSEGSQPTVTTTLKYNTSPPVSLIFENGKFKERQ